MARKNRNAGGRKHDTRMTFKQVCKTLGLTPVERIQLYKRIKKGGEHLK